jgi:hypothetical protein
MPGRQAPVGPEPTSVDEAQADIDRWSAQLGIASAQPSPTTSPAGTGAGPVPPPAAPPRPAQMEPQSTAAPTSVSSESGGGDTRAADSSSQCVSPCRAIASMRRSVAALCRLAGEDDPKCVAARKTLDEGERRVARCGC